MKCLPVFNGFFLPSFTEFLRRALGYIECWVLPSFTGFYRVLLGFTGSSVVVTVVAVALLPPRSLGLGVATKNQKTNKQTKPNKRKKTPKTRLAYRVFRFPFVFFFWYFSYKKKHVLSVVTVRFYSTKSHRNGRVITGFYCFFFFLNRIVCVFLWSFTDCYLV